MGESNVWDDPERAQALGKERAALEAIVGSIETLTEGANDTGDLLDLVVAENDVDSLEDIKSEIQKLIEILDALEFRRMFSGEVDENNAYLDIQSGSGGTEAQDWAEMLLRMYLR